MEPASPDHGSSRDVSILHFPAPYEERYRWTPQTVTGAALGAVSLLAAILVPAMPLLARVPLAVAGTAGAVTSIAYSASRKVAFRVDQKGVTLGGGPFRYEAHTSFFPWEDVHAIVLWERTGRLLAMRRPPVRYISVQRHTELPEMPSGGSGTPAPEDLKAGATRGMQAFRVDDARLAAALAMLAPVVALIRLP